MKKKLIYILVGTLALSNIAISGCGSSSNSEKITTDIQATSENLADAKDSAKESDEDSKKDSAGETTTKETTAEETTTEETTTKKSQKKKKDKNESETTSHVNQLKPNGNGNNTEASDIFFSDSVFVGDSVMTGFMYYVQRQPSGFMGNPGFLALTNFSAIWALRDVTSTSVHPSFRGQKDKIENLLPKMNAKKIFLFFGLNDVGAVGLNKTIANYKQVIANILAKNPDIQINIISTTPMYRGSERGSLNNVNIARLNDAMSEYCASNGYGFVDIASYLMDSDGTLRADYSSDSYVHETNAAYKIWEIVLRGFATNSTVEKSTEKVTEETTKKKEDKTTEVTTKKKKQTTEATTKKEEQTTEATTKKRKQTTEATTKKRKQTTEATTKKEEKTTENTTKKKEDNTTEPTAGNIETASTFVDDETTTEYEE